MRRLRALTAIAAIILIPACGSSSSSDYTPPAFPVELMVPVRVANVNTTLSYEVQLVTYSPDFSESVIKETCILAAAPVGGNTQCPDWGGLYRQVGWTTWIEVSPIIGGIPDPLSGDEVRIPDVPDPLTWAAAVLITPGPVPFLQMTTSGPP